MSWKEHWIRSLTISAGFLSLPCPNLSESLNLFVCFVVVVVVSIS